MSLIFFPFQPASDLSFRSQVSARTVCRWLLAFLLKHLSSISLVQASGTWWCCSQLRDPVTALHMDRPLCWNPAFSTGFAFKREPELLCKFIMNLTRRLLVAIAVICKLETNLCYQPVFAAQMATWKYNFLFVFRPSYHNTIPTAKILWNYHQL